MAQIISRVRDRLDEQSTASSPNWTDINIRRWGNEGLEFIARETECLLATTTIAVVAGTQTYSTAAINPSFTRIHTMRFEPTGVTNIYNLTYHDFNIMDRVWGSWPTRQGDPEVWTAWGYPPSLSIILYPVPSRAGLLRLYYYRLPTKITETTNADDGLTLDLPAGWDDLLVMYVEYSALRADRDPRWQEAHALFHQALERMIFLTQRPSDQSGSMVMAGTALVPRWLSEGY